MVKNINNDQELAKLKNAYDRINKLLEEDEKLNQFERLNMKNNQQYVMAEYIKKGGSLTALIH